MTPYRQLLIVIGLLVSMTPGVVAQDRPLRKVIDDEVRAGWAKEKRTPAPRSSDTEFLRRVFLDLIGVIPTYSEAKSFLEDTRPNRRELLVDQLLNDPRHGSYQAQIWDLVLFGRNPPNADATRKRDAFREWLTNRIAKNVPYDQWVSELLRAESDGPEMFYVQYRNQPEDATVAVSRIFLGTQLQCARCHDHPYERWTQKDFYGMAGFFVRLVVLDGPGSDKMKRYRVAEKSAGEVYFSGSVKEQRPGQKGEPVRARYLGGDELPEPELPKGFKDPDFKGSAKPPRPLFSRKDKLAEWVTSADNPYFARALANRVWAQFLGRGLVHPVDDLSEKNTASHPALLDALARHVVAQKFDLKSLIRELVNSETYQLASTGPSAEAMPEWFERARVRPLSAEELWGSLKVASQFPSDGFKGSGEPTEYVLRFFGEPTDGQGHFQGSVAEHLFLNNAPQVRMMAQARKGNLSDELLKMEGPWDTKVDRLFLSVLSRPPSPAERERFVRHLTTSDSKMAPTLLEEAVWVLMTCSEFRFNH